MSRSRASQAARKGCGSRISTRLRAGCRRCAGRGGRRLLAVLGRRLPEQRARRLLEDPAPGASPLALLGEVSDHLAHARGGDLDAVLAADGAEAVVVLRELER